MLTKRLMLLAKCLSEVSGIEFAAARALRNGFHEQYEEKTDEAKKYRDAHVECFDGEFSSPHKETPLHG